ncbi:MAG: hypothetical protein LQ351_001793 [Letrouitia transgressa]|nr:MAG: hypothetical protein LQ351_001793 [Letrouitia transgressa]
MTSTGFEASPAWSWPKDIPPTFAEPTTSANSPPHTANEGVDPSAGPGEARGSSPRRQPKPEKHWPPRTCRICLETVLPTFHPPTESIPSMLRPSPSVTYESSSPELGKLLRPCKCKGSSKYVHEGCLQAWRHADPEYGQRNYWHCPTCGFQYRLERLKWGRWISSTATQIILTTSILFTTVFLAGFAGDFIINLYLDPYFFISTRPWAEFGAKFEPIVLDDDAPPSWTEHFLKGFASVGLLGFGRVLFALSPWQWWNLRGSGIISSGGGGRSGNSGRDRMASINWIVVLIGVGTFLWAVYKGVRAWSRRTLEKAGEKVMDVPGDGDDDGEDEQDTEQDFHAPLS